MWNVSSLRFALSYNYPLNFMKTVRQMSIVLCFLKNKRALSFAPSQSKTGAPVRQRYLCNGRTDKIGSRICSVVDYFC